MPRWFLVLVKLINEFTFDWYPIFSRLIYASWLHELCVSRDIKQTRTQQTFFLSIFAIRGVFVLLLLRYESQLDWNVFVVDRKCVSSGIKYARAIHHHNFYEYKKTLISSRNSISRVGRSRCMHEHEIHEVIVQIYRNQI